MTTAHWATKMSDGDLGEQHDKMMKMTKGMKKTELPEWLKKDIAAVENELRKREII